MWDDYSEVQPGATDELLQLLERYCSKPPVVSTRPTGGPSYSKSDTGGSSDNPRYSFNSLANWWKNIRSVLPAQGLLGSHDTGSGQASATLPGACPTILQTPNPSHDFVLLCVPFRQRASKLYQAEVCKINSDQEFFQILRHYYSKYRGTRPWDRLRKVRAIEFIEVSEAWGLRASYAHTQK